MAYQQQNNMQYSQDSQPIPHNNRFDDSPMTALPQQHNSMPTYHQPPASIPPPPMRIVDTTVYNSQTNKPLYAFSFSAAPDSDLPNSLLTLRHVPTGVTIGTVRRGGSSAASTCWGTCSCFSSRPDEDVVTVGFQRDEAVIQDLGTGGSTCSAWKPTWAKNGSAEQWAFLGSAGFGGGMVLRDAVANGRDVLTVEGGGDIKFGAAGMALTEDMVGEVILVMVNLRVNRDEERQGWLWELLCW